VNKIKKPDKNNLIIDNSTEILCIGTEILLGNIVNTNSQWIAEELSALGIPHYQQNVVGDNFIRIKQSILDASKRSRYLITTGGLGPTPDDLTTEAIASSFDAKLKLREYIWEDIKQKLTYKDIEPLEINKKQAYFPGNAEIILNKKGTAPGMIWSPIKNFTIITLPGVPDELKSMWTKELIPWFQKNTQIERKYVSKILKFSGISESALSDKVNDLLSSINPTVAPYASLEEVRLRITAEASDTNTAEKIIEPLETELRRRTGNNFWGYNNQTLSSVVINLLERKQQTLSVAESCTGGGVGSELSSVPGASKVFVGGVIAYNNSVKKDFLGVSQELLEEHGAVSSKVAALMAIESRRRFKTDWAIAISGLAGPGGGSISKPIGLVHIAISGPNGIESFKETFNPCKGRRNIQILSVFFSLNKLRLLLLKQN